MPKSPPLTGVVGTLPLPNTAPTPAPGELVRAEDIWQLAQPLLNQDATLEAELVLTNEGLGIGKELAFNIWFNSTTGAFMGGVGSLGIPAGQGAVIPLDLCVPHGRTVETFKVRLAPAVHAALPATMPRLTLSKFTLAAALVTANVQIDTSPNVGVYNVAHDVTLTLPSPIQLDRETFVYILTLDGEAGANSATLPIGPARIEIT